MPSIIPGYAYDIFISYRQKDNKYDGWVTEFVDNLTRELEATFKEDVSIYFDENLHDGLLESHDVDESLKEKLRCLVFIPILSRTYCDQRSFAWRAEFKEFRRMGEEGNNLKVKLLNGNIASRILPVRIHELSADDVHQLEIELGGALRCIDFIYRSAGVNRPLGASEDHPAENALHLFYRDQLNKVANSIHALVEGMRTEQGHLHSDATYGSQNGNENQKQIFGVIKRYAYRAKQFILSKSFAWMMLLVLSAFSVASLVKNSHEPETKRYSIVTSLDRPVALVGSAHYSSGQRSFDINASGTQILYVAVVDTSTMIYVRDLNDFSATPLKGTEGAYRPTYSPDGNSIAFFAQGKLKLVGLDGRTPVDVVRVSAPDGLHWLDNDRILISNNEGREQLLIDRLGHVLRTHHEFLRFCSATIYKGYPTAIGTGDLGQIAMLNLETGEFKSLGIRGSSPVLVSDDMLLYNQRSNLFAVRLGLSKGIITGQSKLVVDNVRSETLGISQYAYSQSGTLIYADGESVSKGELTWINKAGEHSLATSLPADYYRQFTLSPNGRYLAYQLNQRNLDGQDLYVYDFSSARAFRLSENSSSPTWRPDSKAIYYTKLNGEIYTVYCAQMGGSRVDSIISAKSNIFPISGGKNSDTLVYVTQAKVRMLNLKSGNVQDITDGTRLAQIDPTEQYMAYSSGQTGQLEVWVMSISDPSNRIKVSRNGGHEPYWSPRGDTIYYKDILSTKMMYCKINYDPGLSAERDHILWRGAYVEMPGYAFTMSPDGQKFLMLTSVETSNVRNELRVIENFDVELRHTLNSLKSDN